MPVSTKGTSRQQRRSITLAPSPRQARQISLNDYSAPDTLSSERNWESTLRSLDEGNMSPDEHEDPGPSYEEQEEEVLRLSRENKDLREELAARPTEDEVYAMRMEWQTSEELFAQSQKDNEQKHTHIESLKQYVKALESKLEETLGEDWKEYCDFPDPVRPPNNCVASTPLPKPGKLRSSASIKRASRHSQSRAISASDARILRELDSAPSNDRTPAGALRALEGIRETRRSVSDSPTTELWQGQGSVSRPTPAEILLAFEAGSGRVERTSHPGARTPTTPNGSGGVTQNELAALVAAIKGIPGSMAVQESVAKEERREEREREEREREEREFNDASRREEQRQAILDVLDTMEGRAEARELRLQGLLAEAKAISGQMEW